MDVPFSADDFSCDLHAMLFLFFFGDIPADVSGEFYWGVHSGVFGEVLAMFSWAGVFLRKFLGIFLRLGCFFGSFLEIFLGVFLRGPCGASCKMFRRFSCRVLERNLSRRFLRYFLGCFFGMSIPYDVLARVLGIVL